MNRSNTLPVAVNLSAPDPDSSGPLMRIVEGHLTSRGRALTGNPPPLYQFWNPEFFGLHKVRLFQNATRDLQDEILDGCARTLLNEAYFIEKSGLAYCAKMILLANSTQTEQVYGLIAADEATHLQWIRPYVEEAQRQNPEGALLRFLSELIPQCDMNTLAYLVQVILEGWGLHHYKTLAKSCQQPELRSIFQAIHRDEAMHHHTGEVVFDSAQITSEQASLITDSLRSYTEMVRVGPQAIVGVLDRLFGGLDKAAKTTVFAELDTEASSSEKLALLRNLMAGPGRERYIVDLDAQGAFTPYSPSACAAIHG